MSVLNWWNRCRTFLARRRFPQRRLRRNPSSRLALEVLEDRHLMTAYTYTLIADSSGPFSTFETPSLNDSGTAAFKANLDAGGTSIVTGSGGATTTVIDESSLLSAFAPIPSINNAGDVAFMGIPDPGGQGVYKVSGGTLATIAQTATSSFSNSVSLNGGGTVAFFATLAGVNGIFTGDGTAAPTSIANTSGSFLNFGTQPSINDSAVVAFFATLDDNEDKGIYMVSGGVPTAIAQDSSPDFFFFSDATLTINNAGLVAFFALKDGGGQGIFTGDGLTTSTYIDDSGPYTNFAGFSLNDGGTIAFRANLKTGGAGIFIGADPVADKVIADGDALDGSIATSVGIFLESLNANGQVVFKALLADGRQGIYRADPVPTVQTVQIDIKPEAINLDNNGVITVALFGSADFDVTTVAIGTVELAGAAVWSSSFADVNQDGRLDLILQFRTQAAAEALKQTYGELLEAADTDATNNTLDSGVSTHQEASVFLTGETLTGQAFSGDDLVDLFLAGKSLKEFLADLDL